jgi:hypothetical protein
MDLTEDEGKGDSNLERTGCVRYILRQKLKSIATTLLSFRVLTAGSQEVFNQPSINILT